MLQSNSNNRLWNAIINQSESSIQMNHVLKLINSLNFINQERMGFGQAF